MANDQFVLSPATVEDVPGMADVYLTAFASDAFSSFAFPRSKISDVEMKQWLTVRFTKVITKRPEMHTFKMLDTSTNKICAFLRWSFPHMLSDEEKATREIEQKEREQEKEKTGVDPMWPVGAKLGACDAFFGALDKKKALYVDDGEMYVAHLLATDPSYQRKGLASRLLSHVLAIADQEKRKCYIEATRAGYPVYFKLGFREVDTLEIDMKECGGDFLAFNTLMIREPQPIS
ncbi:acyl-CoA N-acyltransferase [Cadophora sp. MPI-SDFR-AT-0126]|nr:acyl-CoA N-acyltransferase [Leotiomycetes sp. MPI-SDFR-AT-0126]